MSWSKYYIDGKKGNVYGLVGGSTQCVCVFFKYYVSAFQIQ